MQITTIKAQPSHYAALADLFEGVFVGEGYAPASSRDRLRDITKVAEAGFLLVATGPQGREVFGAVALDSHHRGHGLGSKLIRACIAQAARCSLNSLVLSTQPSMFAAQGLYLSEGFKRVASRDWMHANGSERLVFSRSLAAH